MPTTYDPAHLWDLVEQTQDGHAEAFGALYDATVQQVYRYIRSRVRSHEIAEDLTADTYLRVLAGIDRIKPVAGSPLAYLYRVAFTLTVDQYRRHESRRSRAVGLFTDAGDLDLADTDAPGPEAEAVTVLDAVELWAGVQRLTERQRDVLVLRFMQGLSVAETAAVVGKSESAVKVLQMRGVRRLRRDPRIAAIATAA